MNTDMLFDETCSPDTRLMKFAQACISAWRGQGPPYDPVEVEMLVFCLRRALQAQRERDAGIVRARQAQCAEWEDSHLLDEAAALIFGRS